MKHMIRLLAAAFAALFAFATPAFAQAQWDNVSRIVAIGDLEGDYAKFTDMLRTSGLIDTQNNWTGGTAHLVQLGDIPDRGDNTRMVLDLLRIDKKEEEGEMGTGAKAWTTTHPAPNRNQQKPTGTT